MPSPKPVPSAPSPILSLVVRTIALGRGSQALLCPGCRLPLNLIQPDENEPTRLLGTCDACGKWGFLVELEPEWQRALFVELPDDATIRRDLAQPEASLPQPRGR